MPGDLVDLPPGRDVADLAQHVHHLALAHPVGHRRTHDVALNPGVLLRPEALDQDPVERVAPQAEEIAKAKMPDLTAADLDAAVRTIAGSARSMGVTVEGVK